MDRRQYLNFFIKMLHPTTNQNHGPNSSKHVSLKVNPPDYHFTCHKPFIKYHTYLLSSLLSTLFHWFEHKKNLKNQALHSKNAIFRYFSAIFYIIPWSNILHVIYYQKRNLKGVLILGYIYWFEVVSENKLKKTGRARGFDYMLSDHKNYIGMV